MNAHIITLWQHSNAGFLAAALPSAGQSQSQDYRAQHYRAEAAECQRVANRWPHDLVRQQYEELARQWCALAEHAEQRR
jgi:hypothetical protein